MSTSALGQITDQMSSFDLTKAWSKYTYAETSEAKQPVIDRILLTVFLIYADMKKCQTVEEAKNILEKPETYREMRNIVRCFFKNPLQQDPSLLLLQSNTLSALEKNGLEKIKKLLSNPPPDLKAILQPPEPKAEAPRASRRGP